MSRHAEAAKPSARRFGSFYAPSPRKFFSPFIAVNQCGVEDP